MPLLAICTNGTLSVSEGEMAKLKEALPKVIEREFSIKGSPLTKFLPREVTVSNFRADLLHSMSVPLVIIAFVPLPFSDISDFEKGEERASKAIAEILNGKKEFFFLAIPTPSCGVLFKPLASVGGKSKRSRR